MRVRSFITPEKALKEMITVVGECWLWTATKPWPGGHCYIAFGGRGSRRQTVHDWLYEYFVEELKKGEHLHHTCPNKNCVNFLKHLQKLTNSEHAKITKFWEKSPR